MQDRTTGKIRANITHGIHYTELGVKVLAKEIKKSLFSTANRTSTQLETISKHTTPSLPTAETQTTTTTTTTATTAEAEAEAETETETTETTETAQKEKTAETAESETIEKDSQTHTQTTQHENPTIEKQADVYDKKLLDQLQ